jgi:hypothetical protein
MEGSQRASGAEDIVPWAQAITWAAIGIGSARSNNLDRATQAEQLAAFAMLLPSRTTRIGRIR